MFPKIVMQYKYPIMIGFILIAAIALWCQYYFQIEVEGFDAVPIQFKDFDKTKMLDGYYKVDDKTMAKIPYGYKLDPNNNMKIIPVTETAKQSISGSKIPPVPSIGKPLPDGYYLLSDLSLAILPPNMMPDVKSVDVSYTSAPPTLMVYYNNGYVSSATYYSKTFPTPQSVKDLVQTNSLMNRYTAPPPKMYFVDSTYQTVSFLAYGKIPDENKKFGFVNDPYLISRTGNFDYANTNFKDIANDVDINYHDSAETIMANSKMSDANMGYINVKDQNGNIVQLPKISAQSSVMYYQPGSFPFGASTYIPKYEDSVYLSRTTNQSTLADYTPLKGDVGNCKKYEGLPAKTEEYCRTLNSGTCSDTSCCVLLGGTKCVAGNAQGPIYKNNYGDFLLRNKDSYYHNGRCYGNCA